MHPLLNPSLRSACHYPICISAQLLEEANGNLFYLSLNESERLQLSITDLVEWIEAVVETKREQLQVQQRKPYSMCFYCWYDALASQLRFSLVSARYQNHLPFRCPLQATTLSTVLHELLFPEAEKYTAKVWVGEAGEQHPGFFLDIWTIIL